MRGSRQRNLWPGLLVLLLLVVIWAGVVVLAFRMGGSDLGVGMLAIGVASLLGSVLTGLVLLPRRARRYAARSQVECAVRVVAGVQPGLGERWQNGVATLVPGRLVFRGYAGGLRFARRMPVTIEVRLIDGSSIRRTSWREVWAVRPGLDVSRLETPSATVEWGLLPKQASWAIERLSPSPVEDDAPE